MTTPEDDNPNQTIQMDIDGLSDVQLIDEAPPVPSSRVVPPPLPPGMGTPSPSMRPSAPPRASRPPSMSQPPKRRTGLYAIVFLVMVVVAVGGGVSIGAALRGTPPAAPAAPSASLSAPSATASAASEPAAEPRVLVLPTIELAEVDAGAK